MNSKIDKVQSQKNNFYRDAFRNLMRVVNTLAVIILILSILLGVFISSKQNNDMFFAQAMEGKKVQMVGLDSPNMGKTAVTTWVSQVVVQIMTFGFNDIDERFGVSKKNFTPGGWEGFRDSMIQSNLIEIMMKSQQIITAIPKEIPELKQEGLIGEKYSWVFDVPLLITFRAGSVKKTFVKSLHLVVEKVPTSDNPDGLGISGWDLR